MVLRTSFTRLHILCHQAIEANTIAGKLVSNATGQAMLPWQSRGHEELEGSTDIYCHCKIIPTDQAENQDKIIHSLVDIKTTGQDAVTPNNLTEIPIDCNQILYSTLWRNLEQHQIPEISSLLWRSNKIHSRCWRIPWRRDIANIGKKLWPLRQDSQELYDEEARVNSMLTLPLHSWVDTNLNQAGTSS